MHKFSIFHYDDSQDILLNVESYIISLNEDFKPIGIEIILSSYPEINKMLSDIKIKAPDLIVLDMYDEHSNTVGENTLQHLKSQKFENPVIIYTQGSVKGYNPHYDELAKLYPFLNKTPILKSIRGNTLKDLIKQYILKIADPNLYSYDQDDTFLASEIRAIGKENINEILFMIKSQLPIEDDITLERLSSGFSGAAVFKMNINGRINILKISREKAALKNELHNANMFYKKFPARLRIDINAIEYSNEQVVAILIEEVNSASPLFSWLKNNRNESEITDFLKGFYFSNGLKTFYAGNRKDENHKFTKIFSGFGHTKLSLVKKAVKELRPLLEHFKGDIPFEDDLIYNIVNKASYKHIDASLLTTASFKKPLVLCHGDFHSNNIMVQDNQPVIIDTGGMKYDFWCMDICRLLVHLYILGLDQNRIDFFDYRTIPVQFNALKKLIDVTALEDYEGGTGYITAINWLLENVENIYGELYSKWEFQLGLMKEFLQASYRVESIPPNKRVLALFAAQQCLRAANGELEKLLQS